MSSPTTTPPVPQMYIRRRSIAGPIVLIALGILFLLGNFHMITWTHLAYYWAKYWPVLIIVWGLIKLVEYMQDSRRGIPPRGIGGGGYVLLVFLIICGMSASAAYKVNWNALSNEMDMDSDWAGLFGNTYTFDQTVEQPFTAGGTLHVVDDRGQVTVNTWDEAKVKVVVKKRIIAKDEGESKTVDQKTQATLTASDNIVTVNANTGGAGNQPVESNLEIYLPKKAQLEVSTRHGDITVTARDGDVQLNTTRGDVTAQVVNGNVVADVRRGSVKVENVKGNVTLSGRIDDTNISDVSGTVALNGDFFGSMMLARIAKGVTFHSSRTDMEMAALAGELNLESGDLRGRSIAGPMRLMTRSKDIRIEDVTGDLKIENSNGLVEYHAGNKLGQVDITNSRGDVQLTFPPAAKFQLEASARRGDIETDYPGINVQTERNDHSATGAVGNGGPQVKVTNTGGDISVRKSSTTPATPDAQGKSNVIPPDSTVAPGDVEKAPKAPKPPKAPPSDTTRVRVHHGRMNGML